MRPTLSRSLLLLAILLTTVGCTKKGSFNGRVVDAFTSKPAGALRVVATATAKPSSASCNSFETTSLRDGTFTLEGLCEKVTYKISSPEKEWFLKGADVAGGIPADKVVDIPGYKIPAAEGLYMASGGDPAQIRQNADVSSSKILDTQEDVFYPREFPKGIQKLTQGKYLLVNGKTRNEKLKFFPLIESGERKFGTTKAPEKSEPWSYMGVRFETDTQYAKVEPQIDRTKVFEFTDADRHATFYSFDSLAPSYYVIMVPGEKRAYLINVVAGDTAKKEAPAAEPPKKDAPAEAKPAAEEKK